MDFRCRLFPGLLLFPFLSFTSGGLHFAVALEAGTFTNDKIGDGNITVELSRRGKLQGTFQFQISPELAGYGDMPGLDVGIDLSLFAHDEVSLYLDVTTHPAINPQGSLNDNGALDLTPAPDYRIYFFWVGPWRFPFLEHFPHPLAPLFFRIRRKTITLTLPRQAAVFLPLPSDNYI